MHSTVRRHPKKDLLRHLRQPNFGSLSTAIAAKAALRFTVLLISVKLLRFIWSTCFGSSELALCVCSHITYSKKLCVLSCALLFSGLK